MYPNKICSVRELDEVLFKMGGAFTSWEYEKKFYKSVKVLDNSVLKILFKQVEKIFDNPNRYNHMCSNRKGQQELYVNKSFRLYYSYSEKDDKIVFLEFSHKDDQ